MQSALLVELGAIEVYKNDSIKVERVLESGRELGEDQTIIKEPKVDSYLKRNFLHITKISSIA